MDEIVGLVEIRAAFEKLDRLPHSFCLVGEEGSGKHVMLSLINERFFSVDYLDMTTTLDDSFIDSIYRYPRKRLYVVDTSDIKQKDQNKILMLLEEPSENTYICLLTKSLNTLLPTIRNRVVAYRLDRYTTSELAAFAKREGIDIAEQYLGSVVRTPGDVLKVRSVNANLDKISDLTRKMVTSMKRASFPNTISILDKINFKDEYDKLDLYFFARSLYAGYAGAYIETSDDTLAACLGAVHDLCSALEEDSRLDKRRAMAVCLTELWRINRGTQRS